MSVNDVTGDPIRTDVPSEKFKSGWDTIWGNKTKPKCYECGGHGFKMGGAFDAPVECGACGDQEP